MAIKIPLFLQPKMNCWILLFFFFGSHRKFSRANDIEIVAWLMCYKCASSNSNNDKFHNSYVLRPCEWSKYENKMANNERMLTASMSNVKCILFVTFRFFFYVLKRSEKPSDSFWLGYVRFFFSRKSSIGLSWLTISMTIELKYCSFNVKDSLNLNIAK